MRNIPEGLARLLSTKLQKEVSLTDALPLTGGSINEAYELVSDAGAFFLKKNNARSFPKMFMKEAEGLELLNANSEFKIPQVILESEIGSESLLVLEFIKAADPANNYWKEFARQLAGMHQTTHKWFGLGHDNYMGSLPQLNQFRESVSDFWVSNRLKPQARMARDKGLLNKNDLQDLTRLYERVEEIIPDEPPALVHGDLWSSNTMADSQGNPCIFDPAVAYSHREVDIAMSTLFGRFGEDFYPTYNEIFPLEAGWQERLDFWNLYPYLVHLNIFGSSYSSTCRSIIRKYS